MGKTFTTNVTTSVRATIDSYNIASIIVEEIDRLLRGKDRFIENGIIKEHDYRFNNPEHIREATEEEIKLYNALLLTVNHFRNLK